MLISGARRRSPFSLLPSRSSRESERGGYATASRTGLVCINRLDAHESREERGTACHRGRP